MIGVQILPSGLNPCRIRRKSGFALIFVITAMALLLTFLIAAQGSVMTSHRVIKRNADRALEAEKLEYTLAEMQHRLEADLKSNRFGPGQTITLGTRDEILILGANDPIYRSLPGLAYRTGDAIVTINNPPPKQEKAAAPKGEPPKQQFLLNGLRMRIGVVRIPG